MSKDVAIEESGLLEEVPDIDSSHLLSDLNSATLLQTMSEAEVGTFDTIFSDEIDFQYYELSSPPPQLQTEKVSSAM